LALLFFAQVPDEAPNKFVLEKQTLRVGSVAVVLAFLLGLSFAFGGKSASVDQLSLDVRDMRNDVKTLATAVNKQNSDSHDAITSMQFAIQALQKEYDDLKSQADYRAAGGKR
jgi:outer membrane murein-binding lipoprotein Lpp